MSDVEENFDAAALGIGGALDIQAETKEDAAFGEAPLQKPEFAKTALNVAEKELSLALRRQGKPLNVKKSIKQNLYAAVIRSTLAAWDGPVVDTFMVRLSKANAIASVFNIKPDAHRKVVERCLAANTFMVKDLELWEASMKNRQHDIIPAMFPEKCGWRKFIRSEVEMISSMREELQKLPVFNGILKVKVMSGSELSLPRVLEDESEKRRKELLKISKQMMLISTQDEEVPGETMTCYIKCILELPKLSNIKKIRETMKALKAVLPGQDDEDKEDENHDEKEAKKDENRENDKNDDDSDDSDNEYEYEEEDEGEKHEDREEDATQSVTGTQNKIEWEEDLAPFKVPSKRSILRVMVYSTNEHEEEATRKAGRRFELKEDLVGQVGVVLRNFKSCQDHIVDVPVYKKKLNVFQRLGGVAGGVAGGAAGLLGAVLGDEETDVDKLVAQQDQAPPPQLQERKGLFSFFGKKKEDTGFEDDEDSESEHSDKDESRKMIRHFDPFNLSTNPINNPFFGETNVLLAGMIKIKFNLKAEIRELKPKAEPPPGMSKTNKLMLQLMWQASGLGLVSYTATLTAQYARKPMTYEEAVCLVQKAFRAKLQRDKLAQEKEEAEKERLLQELEETKAKKKGRRGMENDVHGLSSGDEKGRRRRRHRRSGEGTDGDTSASSGRSRRRGRSSASGTENEAEAAKRRKRKKKKEKGKVKKRKDLKSVAFWLTLGVAGNKVVEPDGRIMPGEGAPHMMRELAYRLFMANKNGKLGPLGEVQRKLVRQAEVFRTKNQPIPAWLTHKEDYGDELNALLSDEKLIKYNPFGPGLDILLKFGKMFRVRWEAQAMLIMHYMVLSWPEDNQSVFLQALKPMFREFIEAYMLKCMTGEEKVSLQVLFFYLVNKAIGLLNYHYKHLQGKDGCYALVALRQLCLWAFQVWTPSKGKERPTDNAWLVQHLSFAATAFMVHDFEPSFENLSQMIPKVTEEISLCTSAILKDQVLENLIEDLKDVRLVKEAQLHLEKEVGEISATPSQISTEAGPASVASGKDPHAESASIADDAELERTDAARRALADVLGEGQGIVTIAKEATAATIAAAAAAAVAAATAAAAAAAAAADQGEEVDGQLSGSGAPSEGGSGTLKEQHTAGTLDVRFAANTKEAVAMTPTQTSRSASSVTSASTSGSYSTGSSSYETSSEGTICIQETFSLILAQKRYQMIMFHLEGIFKMLGGAGNLAMAGMEKLQGAFLQLNKMLVQTKFGAMYMYSSLVDDSKSDSLSSISTNSAKLTSQIVLAAARGQELNVHARSSFNRSLLTGSAHSSLGQGTEARTGSRVAAKSSIRPGEFLANTRNVSVSIHGSSKNENMTQLIPLWDIQPFMFKAIIEWMINSTKDVLKQVQRLVEGAEDKVWVKMNEDDKYSDSVVTLYRTLQPNMEMSLKMSALIFEEEDMEELRQLIARNLVTLVNAYLTATESSFVEVVDRSIPEEIQMRRESIFVDDKERFISRLALTGLMNMNSLVIMCIIRNTIRKLSQHSKQLEVIMAEAAKIWEEKSKRMAEEEEALLKLQPKRIRKKKKKRVKISDKVDVHAMSTNLLEDNDDDDDYDSEEESSEEEDWNVDEMEEPPELGLMAKKEIQIESPPWLRTAYMVIESLSVASVAVTGRTYCARLRVVVARILVKALRHKDDGNKFVEGFKSLFGIQQEEENLLKKVRRHPVTPILEDLLSCIYHDLCLVRHETMDAQTFTDMAADMWQGIMDGIRLVLINHPVANFRPLQREPSLEVELVQRFVLGVHEVFDELQSSFARVTDFVKEKRMLMAGPVTAILELLALPAEGVEGLFVEQMGMLEGHAKGDYEDEYPLPRMVEMPADVQDSLVGIHPMECLRVMRMRGAAGFVAQQIMASVKKDLLMPLLFNMVSSENLVSTTVCRMLVNESRSASRQRGELMCTQHTLCFTTLLADDLMEKSDVTLMMRLIDINFIGKTGDGDSEGIVVITADRDVHIFFSFIENERDRMIRIIRGTIKRNRDSARAMLEGGQSIDGLVLRPNPQDDDNPDNVPLMSLRAKLKNVFIHDKGLLDLFPDMLTFEPLNSEYVLELPFWAITSVTVKSEMGSPWMVMEIYGFLDPVMLGDIPEAALNDLQESLIHAKPELDPGHPDHSLEPVKLPGAKTPIKRYKDGKKRFMFNREGWKTINDTLTAAFTLQLRKEKHHVPSPFLEGLPRRVVQSTAGSVVDYAEDDLSDEEDQSTLSESMAYTLSNLSYGVSSVLPTDVVGDARVLFWQSARVPAEEGGTAPGTVLLTLHYLEYCAGGGAPVSIPVRHITSVLTKTHTNKAHTWVQITIKGSPKKPLQFGGFSEWAAYALHASLSSALEDMKEGRIPAGPKEGLHKLPHRELGDLRQTLSGGGMMPEKHGWFLDAQGALVAGWMFECTAVIPPGKVAVYLSTSGITLKQTMSWGDLPPEDVWETQHHDLSQFVDVQTISESGSPGLRLLPAEDQQELKLLFSSSLIRNKAMDVVRALISQAMGPTATPGALMMDGAGEDQALATFQCQLQLSSGSASPGGLQITRRHLVLCTSDDVLCLPLHLVSSFDTSKEGSLHLDFPALPNKLKLGIAAAAATAITHIAATLHAPHLAEQQALQRQRAAMKRSGRGRQAGAEDEAAEAEEDMRSQDSQGSLHSHTAGSSLSTDSHPDPDAPKSPKRKPGPEPFRIFMRKLGGLNKGAQPKVVERFGYLGGAREEHGSPPPPSPGTDVPTTPSAPSSVKGSRRGRASQKKDLGLKQLKIQPPNYSSDFGLFETASTTGSEQGGAATPKPGGRQRKISNASSFFSVVGTTLATPITLIAAQAAADQAKRAEARRSRSSGMLTPGSSGAQTPGSSGAQTPGSPGSVLGGDELVGQVPAPVTAQGRQVKGPKARGARASEPETPGDMVPLPGVGAQVPAAAVAGGKQAHDSRSSGALSSGTKTSVTPGSGLGGEGIIAMAPVVAPLPVDDSSASSPETLRASGGSAVAGARVGEDFADMAAVGSLPAEEAPMRMDDQGSLLPVWASLCMLRMQVSTVATRGVTATPSGVLAVTPRSAVYTPLITSWPSGSSDLRSGSGLSAATGGGGVGQAAIRAALTDVTMVYTPLWAAERLELNMRTGTLVFEQFGSGEERDKLAGLVRTLKAAGARTSTSGGSPSDAVLARLQCALEDGSRPGEMRQGVLQLSGSRMSFSADGAEPLLVPLLYVTRAALPKGSNTLEVTVETPLASSQPSYSSSVDQRKLQISADQPSTAALLMVRLSTALDTLHGMRGPARLVYASSRPQSGSSTPAPVLRESPVGSPALSRGPSGINIPEQPRFGYGSQPTVPRSSVTNPLAAARSGYVTPPSDPTSGSGSSSPRDSRSGVAAVTSAGGAATAGVATRQLPITAPAAPSMTLAATSQVAASSSAAPLATTGAASRQLPAPAPAAAPSAVSGVATRQLSASQSTTSARGRVADVPERKSGGGAGVSRSATMTQASTMSSFSLSDIPTTSDVLSSSNSLSGTSDYGSGLTTTASESRRSSAATSVDALDSMLGMLQYAPARDRVPPPRAVPSTQVPSRPATQAPAQAPAVTAAVTTQGTERSSTVAASAAVAQPLVAQATSLSVQRQGTFTAAFEPVITAPRSPSNLSPQNQGIYTAASEPAVTVARSSSNLSLQSRSTSVTASEPVVTAPRISSNLSRQSPSIYTAASEPVVTVARSSSNLSVQSQSTAVTASEPSVTMPRGSAPGTELMDSAAAHRRAMATVEANLAAAALEARQRMSGSSVPAATSQTPQPAQSPRASGSSITAATVPNPQPQSQTSVRVGAQVAAGIRQTPLSLTPRSSVSSVSLSSGSSVLSSSLLRSHLSGVSVSSTSTQRPNVPGQAGQNVPPSGGAALLSTYDARVSGSMTSTLGSTSSASTPRGQSFRQ